MVFILLSEYQQLLDEEDGRGLDSSAVRKAGIYAVAVDLDGVEKAQQGRDSQEKSAVVERCEERAMAVLDCWGTCHTPTSHTLITNKPKQSKQTTVKAMQCKS